MSDNWVDGALESGADEGAADIAADDTAADDTAAGDLAAADDIDTAIEAGDVDNPTPLSGAELGLQGGGEPNSFEPEEADPAVTPDPADEPEPEDFAG